MIDSIDVIGAHENNLKNVNLTIPKGKLVVFTGLSGSGKSSLVFGTLAVESSRQWQSTFPLYVRNKMTHYERPQVEEIRNLTPAVVINQKPMGTGTRSTVGTAVDVAPLLRLLFSRVGEPSAGGSMAYSPNHPQGACPACTGLGEQMVLHEESLLDTSKSLSEGAIVFSQFSAGWQAHLYQNNPVLDANKKLADFSEDEMRTLLWGTDETIKVEIRSNNTGRVDKVEYEGVIPRFKRLYLSRDISKLRKNLQDEVSSHITSAPCEDCEGSGLNRAALESRINGYNIVDFMNLPVSDLLPMLATVDTPRGESLARQASDYLKRMVDVGVGYLSLNRSAATLSGGEAQRLKIVRHLGNTLNNITYIFDEPTAGLHPHDAQKIGKLLVDLRDRGNNVLVVEHNRHIVELADHIIEMGPCAGTAGGEVVFEGTLAELKSTHSPTAEFMQSMPALNTRPRPWNSSFTIKDAQSHNLNHVNVEIPRGVLTAVCGVAGSGKSSLVIREFATMFPDAIVVNQQMIGMSSRSTPATYTGVMDSIRKLFASENKVTASWFSFNSKGACEVCKGKGTISYDMAFAEPVEVTCEQCRGIRYNEKALSFTYKGKNIVDVLNLTVAEAVGFFEHPTIAQRLRTMEDVGLGYLTLGQPTSTLSGGEVQRLKLSSELHKSGEVYVLDEPSTGMHHRNLQDLKSLLNQLIDNGNTVVMVEHNLELIAHADWVIEMGPGGGTNGGRVMFTGTPEELAEDTSSVTGGYLRGD